MKIAVLDTTNAGMASFDNIRKKYPNNDIEFLIFKVNKSISEHTHDEKIELINKRIIPVLKKKKYDLVYIAINSLSIFIEKNNITLGDNIVTALDMHKLQDKDSIILDKYLILTNQFSKDSKWFDEVYPGITQVVDNELKMALFERDSQYIMNNKNKYDDFIIIPGCSDFESLVNHGYNVLDIVNNVSNYNITNDSEKRHSLQDVITKDYVIEACII